MRRLKSPLVGAFFAGSAAGVPGTDAVGMPVSLHNRRRRNPAEAGVQPRFVSDSLWPLVGLV